MKDDTRLVHAGKDPEHHYGIVNMPVYRASTVLSPTLSAFKARAEGDRKYRGVRYGAYGTPTTFALADAVAGLEGGAGAVATASGLSAVTMALAAFVRQGDHILMVDSVYSPTREFCDAMLARFGVETTYYDPLIGESIEGLIRPETRIVFCESPGSLTFEVQDIPAIAAAAHRHGAVVLLDNTWATPLFFKPFDHGVDVSIQAGTKYISGHSDLVIGIVTARTEELFRRLKDTTFLFGDIPGPDDCYLALRGLRSMGARLRRHQESAMTAARWLQARPEVRRVLFPALPGDPGHDLWRRDFTGASSLFGVVLETGDEAAVARMVDGYRYFKIGASWGGYESLVLPANPKGVRTAAPWTAPGYVLRFHVGLEDPEDLIADLADGFMRLAG
ncbi:cystathionine beta-lyase [Desulfococcus sp.]|uniref:cystathionine beta-lyase n=1 Tax=Desulfococcus sp. TaxID=2025834 RepID=UPI003592F5C3